MKYLIFILLGSLMLPNSPITAMKRERQETNSENNQARNTSKKQPKWTFVTFQTNNNTVTSKQVTTGKNGAITLYNTLIDRQVPTGNLNEFSVVPERSSAPRLNENIEQNLMFRCLHPACGAYFRSQRELATHEKFHRSHYMIYKCQSCNALFPDKERLKTHILSDHVESFVSQYVDQLQPIPMQMYNPQSYGQHYNMPITNRSDYQHNQSHQQAQSYPLDQYYAHTQETINPYWQTQQYQAPQNNQYIDPSLYTQTQTDTYPAISAQSFDTHWGPTATTGITDNSAYSDQNIPVSASQNDVVTTTQGAHNTNTEVIVQDVIEDEIDVFSGLDPEDILFLADERIELPTQLGSNNQAAQNSNNSASSSPSSFIKLDDNSNDGSYEIFVKTPNNNSFAMSQSTESSNGNNIQISMNPVSESQNNDCVQPKPKRLSFDELEIDLNNDLETKKIDHENIGTGEVSTQSNSPQEQDFPTSVSELSNKEEALQIPSSEPEKFLDAHQIGYSQKDDHSQSDEEQLSITQDEESELTDDNKPQQAVKNNLQKSDLFVCDHPGCNQTFVDKYNRVKHMRTHTGEKPYKCTFKGCKMAFAHKSNLNRHMDTHEDISTVSKHFKCTHEGCSQSFKENAKLVRHMLTHTGFKNFICKHKGCAKAFGTNDKLKRHMKTHSEKRNYKCSYKRCNKAYKDKSDLKAHEKTHTDTQEEFKCPISGCDKSYAQKKSLNRHLKTHSEKD